MSFLKFQLLCLEHAVILEDVKFSSLAKGAFDSKEKFKKAAFSEMAGEGISGGCYWYCGAAVCRIKLQKETLPEKTDGEIFQNTGNQLWSRSWKFCSNS